jgi:hypothetical protein
MNAMIRRLMIPACALAVSATVCAAAAAPAAATGPAASAQWQARKIEFTYFGITTRYSCDGIEGKVREILLALGARADLQVRATGCDLHDRFPGRSAWVNAQFSSLAPATDTVAEGSVPGVWAQVRLAPDQPRDMAAGDCELVEQMRELLLKNFTLRNPDFRAACFPHEISPNGYALKAELLRPVAPPQQRPAASTP